MMVLLKLDCTYTIPLGVLRIAFLRTLGAGFLTISFCSCLAKGLLLSYFFLLATVFLLPFLVRELVLVR